MKTVKRNPHWPKWAKYVAIDKNRKEVVFSHKPIKMKDVGEWDIKEVTHRYEYTNLVMFEGNWKKSLRRIEQ